MRHGLTRPGATSSCAPDPRPARRADQAARLVAAGAREHRLGRAPPRGHGIAVGETEVELTLATRDDEHCAGPARRDACARATRLTGSSGCRSSPRRARSRAGRLGAEPQRRNSTAWPPRAPVGDAAVEHRARVDARGREDARGDRGARAALADRHDRPVAGRPSAPARATQPVRDVAAARDVAAVALVRLAYVDHARRRPRAARSSSSSATGAASARRRRRARSRRARGSRPRAGRGRRARPPRARRRVQDDRSSGSSTNPALVAKPRRRRGTLSAPGTCPAANSSAGAHVEHGAPSAPVRELLERRRRAPTNGPRLSATIRSMFGGRGAGAAVDSATKSSSSSRREHGLKRRSKPIVVDAFELIAAPHSEPATWPG